MNASDFLACDVSPASREAIQAAWNAHIANVRGAWRAHDRAVGPINTNETFRAYCRGFAEEKRISTEAILMSERAYRSIVEPICRAECRVHGEPVA